MALAKAALVVVVVVEEEATEEEIVSGVVASAESMVAPSLEAMLAEETGKGMRCLAVTRWSLCYHL